MADEKDPPIEAPGYLSGVTVIYIGDVRVARGLSRRSHSSCRHPRLMYDQKERRIWCQDCERDVEAFDAFETIVTQHFSTLASIKQRQTALTEAEKFQMRTIAGKKMDEAWRSKNMVPACPHCNYGLFPEDFKHGIAMVGKEYAQARIAAKTKRTPPQTPGA